MSKLFEGHSIEYSTGDESRGWRLLTEGLHTGDKRKQRSGVRILLETGVAAGTISLIGYLIALGVTGVTGTL